MSDPKNRAVKYIKCPVCREFMRRNNFAQKSGVIVDRCSAHGLWLDSGEVTHLLEWKKAGGQLLHAQVQMKQTPRAKKMQNDFSSSLGRMSKYKQESTLEADLLELLASIARKIV
ncbi:zf-TFIIB domain-containing protein [Methyloprofundus sp.]|uniref:zf-TFIIB domain-containing protein n=1 Tax=Methyloprofundus sp. TaxID=2020875 RepID=UPI003D0ADFFE